MTDKRVGTGVSGLDEMLRGGFIPGSTVLLRGAAGTGKTSLSLQYLVHGAKNEGETGLLISFEEFPRSLYRDADSLGWDLEELERGERLHLMFTSPEVFLAGLEIPDSPLEQVLRQNHVQRLVLDSVTHFDRMAKDPLDLRRIYSRVANGLRREGVTSVLLAEDSRTGTRQVDRSGLSFVVDTVLLLRYVEIESAIQRAMVVIKMRGSDHDKEIKRFEIQSGGLVVMDTFEGRQGLLMGSPYRTS